MSERPPVVPGWGLATQALHAHLRPDATTGAVQPGIAMSVNHLFTPGEAAFSADGVEDLAQLPFLYARWGNPTVRQLEQRLAALEGAEDALATATGVAAVAAVCFGLLRAGDHVVLSDVCYAGAQELVRGLLPDFGVEVTAVNLSDLAALRAAMRPQTRLVHAETPCNPLLRLTDLRAVADIAHAQGALLSVDSTLATPVFSQPLAHGAELVARLRARAGVYLGATLSAHTAWLSLRGIDTLDVRLRRSADSAGRIARFLQGHPAVRAVTWPGLPEHPQHALAQRQMPGFGAVLTFQVQGHGPAVAERLARRLQVAHYAFSLGHQRSLVVWLGSDELLASSFPLQGEALADYRRFAGDGVFRLSVGLEDPADLIADLDQALRADD